jgi:hypothetical protein
MLVVDRPLRLDAISDVSGNDISMHYVKNKTKCKLKLNWASSRIELIEVFDCNFTTTEANGTSNNSCLNFWAGRLTQSLENVLIVEI